ncbi:Uma2 family endonuclease [Nocardiopsis sp. LOL_012]|uniref:Uma2 family endonuclease n=1 Tax=Nocardiopsis sp. LOL_012 TaxID=3345409 RepID=UPI003A8B35EC
MTTGQTDLGPRPLTVDDLHGTPDDGRRYELVDGRLDVSPAPVFLHSRVESRLNAHLTFLAPEGFEVVSTPGINFDADRTHHRVPDLVVIGADGAEEPYLTRPPLLAVEVVSPESSFRDHYTKRQEYAKFGIPSYWIITPDQGRPHLIELRLSEGEYREVSSTSGDDLFETELPFPVRTVPLWLVAPGPWRGRVGGGRDPE